MDKETRVFEVRAVKTNDGPVFEGYAARFNSDSVDLGGFVERIKRGAFTRTLKEQKDIRAFFNHDSAYVLGRTTNKTLELEENTVGLKVRVVPPKTQWAQDLAESVSRGDINQMSFGFWTDKDTWEEKDGKVVRTLEEVTLLEVSIVAIPAYPSTSVALRSLDQWKKSAANFSVPMPQNTPAGTGSVLPVPTPGGQTRDGQLATNKPVNKGGGMKTKEELYVEIQDLDKRIGDTRAVLVTEKRDPTVEEAQFITSCLDRIEECRRLADLLDRMDSVAAAVAKPAAPAIKPDNDDDSGNGARALPTAISSVSLPNASKREFRSFGEFLACVIQAGMPSGEMDARLLSRRSTGLNELVGSEGGFLVDTTWANEILARAYEMGQILSRVDRYTIGANSNGLTVNAINESSRVNGSRWGGIQAYWQGEGGQLTASKPDFRQMELKLRKLTGLCYLTDELLQDSTALESIVRKGFAEEIVFRTEDAIINGTGSGQPLGIMNSACMISTTATRAAGNFEYLDVVSMFSRMWARSRMTAVWLINQDVEPHLYTMTMPGDATSGVLTPVYLPPGGASAAPYGTLLGRPVIPVEYCQTVGTAGDVILADFSEYAFIVKGQGVDIASSIHLRFDYGETALRFVFRCDGQPKWQSALTPFKGSNTLSPFVRVASGS